VVESVVVLVFFGEEVVSNDITAIITPPIPDQCFFNAIPIGSLVTVQIVVKLFMQIDHRVVASVYILSGNPHKTRSLYEFFRINDRPRRGALNSRCQTVHQDTVSPVS